MEGTLNLRRVNIYIGMYPMVWLSLVENWVPGTLKLESYLENVCLIVFGYMCRAHNLVYMLNYNL